MQPTELRGISGVSTTSEGLIVVPLRDLSTGKLRLAMGGQGVQRPMNRCRLIPQHVWLATSANECKICSRLCLEAAGVPSGMIESSAGGCRALHGMHRPVLTVGPQDLTVRFAEVLVPAQTGTERTATLHDAHVVHVPHVSCTPCASLHTCMHV